MLEERGTDAGLSAAHEFSAGDLEFAVHGHGKAGASVQPWGALPARRDLDRHSEPGQSSSKTLVDTAIQVSGTSHRALGNHDAVGELAGVKDGASAGRAPHDVPTKSLRLIAAPRVVHRFVATERQGGPAPSVEPQKAVTGGSHESERVVARHVAWTLERTIVPHVPTQGVRVQRENEPPGSSTSTRARSPTSRANSWGSCSITGQVP